MTVAIVSFVIVFALVVAAAGAGFKFFETRRRQSVAGMLRAVAGESESVTTTVLRDLESRKSSPMEALIKRLKVGDRVRAAIQQAGLNWTPARLLTMMIGAGCGGLAFGLAVPFGVSHSVNGFGLCLALGAAPYLYVLKKRKKRLAMLEEQFPEALDFLARSMRAGHAFSISLEMLGEELPDPLGLEFRTLAHELNLGAPVETALANLCERVPLLDLRFFASAVLLQKQTGGNLSEILGRLSYVIRERFRLKGQVRAASSHGRLTAAILSALPVFTGLAMLVVAPSYLAGMWEDPDGKKIVCAAIVAQVLGNWVIKRIIDIKV
jgi:tight adherence protein B